MSELISSAVELPDSVRQTLEHCLSLESRFQTSPTVRLELVTQPVDGELDISPNDVAVFTAVQCYSPGKAIVRQRRDDRSDAIRQSTLEAGHLTTRQHAHFTFHLGEVTRSAVHDVFHDYPYYNSEQQSQRYVEAKDGFFQVPILDNPVAQEKYIEIAQMCNTAYFELLENLQPEVEQRVKQMYPRGWDNPKRREELDNKVKKLCQEVARYVLPIAQFTQMKHTISHLQLLRLFHVINHPSFSDEARLVIAKMIKAVGDEYPDFYQELGPPMVFEPIEDTAVWQDLEDYARDFDAQLVEGTSTKMLSNLAGQQDALIASLANVAIANGVSPKVESGQLVDMAVNPAKNPFIADLYGGAMHDPLSQCLRMVHLEFMSKVSHTGDSQRQRQRTTPGTSPNVSDTYFGKPDYVVPLAIRENPEVKAKFEGYMQKIYAGINELIKMGVPQNQATMLLPNAHAVRIVETGDLLGWFHRFRQRLCYLAQEEFFFLSVDQAEQVAAQMPELMLAIQAPCGLHKQIGKTPYCPEGNRFCGKPVWNYQTMQKYREERVI